MLLPLPVTQAVFFCGRALRSPVAQLCVFGGLHMISSYSLPRREISYFTNLISYCLARRSPCGPMEMLVQHFLFFFFYKKKQQAKPSHPGKARSKATPASFVSPMLFKAPPDWGQLSVGVCTITVLLRRGSRVCCIQHYFQG